MDQLALVINQWLIISVIKYINIMTTKKREDIQEEGKKYRNERDLRRRK